MGAGGKSALALAVRRQARKFRGGKRPLEHYVLYKKPRFRILPGTSQTAGCASCPSGVHPLSCPCNLVNTFQMSLMEIMCGFGPQRLPTATTRLSQKALAVNAAVAMVTRAQFLHLEAVLKIITSRSEFTSVIVECREFSRGPLYGSTSYPGVVHRRGTEK